MFSLFSKQEEYFESSFQLIPRFRIDLSALKEYSCCSFADLAIDLQLSSFKVSDSLQGSLFYKFGGFLITVTGVDLSSIRRALMGSCQPFVELETLQRKGPSFASQRRPYCHPYMYPYFSCKFLLKSMMRLTSFFLRTSHSDFSIRVSTWFVLFFITESIFVHHWLYLVEFLSLKSSLIRRLLKFRRFSTSDTLPSSYYLSISFSLNAASAWSAILL